MKRGDFNLVALIIALAFALFLGIAIGTAATWIGAYWHGYSISSLSSLNNEGPGVAAGARASAVTASAVHAEEAGAEYFPVTHGVLGVRSGLVARFSIVSASPVSAGTSKGRSFALGAFCHHKDAGEGSDAAYVVSNGLLIRARAVIRVCLTGFSR